MNAVEIELALSDLSVQPFDGEEFPYSFLTAFGNKETAIARLRKGESNASDVAGGVLQRNNIHISVCESGRVGKTLKALRTSPKTTSTKVKFILATDGETLEAEDLISGETISSEYGDFAEHLGFFLPLAGISTIKQIKDNPVDVRATGRLNKLYVELLKDNPQWATETRRHDMNHFMARLVFCFFAEDTGIFQGTGLFTKMVEQMSARDSSNTHEVIETAFRAMNVKHSDRAKAKLPSWVQGFPYVNGGLFSGSTSVPHFSRMARTYLLHAGDLNWCKINPDIFGSMIQAVADDDERGALGMHYTSVPNIRKVLNPLFLDNLREQMKAAGDNSRMLLNLRKRMSRIRVFDPACGSGNFLVIAYKDMRAIEAEINRLRGEPGAHTEIHLTNFRGIELRDFPAEIARLALVIAEYQCDVTYRGLLIASGEFLPLKMENWITCNNALRLDWLSVCPPTGKEVKYVSDNLFPVETQGEIDFENEGGETYICGNPPYIGSNLQTAEHKSDLRGIFEQRTANWKSLDYVAGWFMKAAEYGQRTNSAAAFVSTNSICQGQAVSNLWSLIHDTDHEISFAHTSFKWANLASHNAGVKVVIVGISNHADRKRHIFSVSDDGGTVVVKEAENINSYLVAGQNVIVNKSARPVNGLSEMVFGNMPNDGGQLLLSSGEVEELGLTKKQSSRFIRRFYGSEEFIHGLDRYCLWIKDEHIDEARAIRNIEKRVIAVKSMRQASVRPSTVALAKRPYQFGEVRLPAHKAALIVPAVSSENREYLPVGLVNNRTIISNLAFAIYDAPLWNLAVIASRLHLMWIATVCGKLGTGFRYSNTMGWNTFPIPILTEQNKADLTRCAENILLAREVHSPATIADLYNPHNMPANLRRAHEQNDEVLERIYIGRRFRNDTERLEKLFDLYVKMTAAPSTTIRKTAA